MIAATGQDGQSGSADGSAGAVVVAAGSGARLGGSRPKALIEVGGDPLVAHAVRAMATGGIGDIVVVCPAGQEAAFAAALRDVPTSAIVPGGPTRTDSVRRGLAALPGVLRVVAVHDAARPLVPAAVVRRTVAALVDGVLAAAPVLDVADTLKRVRAGRVIATVDRSGLAGVQTPQVFRRAVLEDVLSGEAEATDELGLVEAWVADGRLTGEIVVVPGSPFAHKVTYPDDLDLVAALARVVGPTT